MTTPRRREQMLKVGRRRDLAAMVEIQTSTLTGPGAPPCSGASARVRRSATDWTRDLTSVTGLRPSSASRSIAETT
jgi:hypothetical protein